VVQHQRRARAAMRRATRRERLGPRCCHGMAPSRAPWPPCWASCAGCRVRWLPRAASKPPRTRTETPDLATLAARWLAGARRGGRAGRTAGLEIGRVQGPRSAASMGAGAAGWAASPAVAPWPPATAPGCWLPPLLVAAAAGCQGEQGTDAWG
jgi:hypothetical protein